MVYLVGELGNECLGQLDAQTLGHQLGQTGMRVARKQLDVVVHLSCVARARVGLARSLSLPAQGATRVSSVADL